MASQISAEISDSTRELLENYTRNTGIKKGFLIEQALLDYIRALQELPVDILIPAKVVTSAESAEKIIRDLRKPRKPTAALRRLMKK